MKNKLATIWNAGPGPESTQDLFVLWLKAFFMGMADLIPGVSGGTIAFITGIYEDLLAAIASVNKEVLKKLLKFEIVEALSMIHWRVILPIGIGAMSAIVSLARVMHYMIKEHSIPTWSFFFGLVIASIVLLWRSSQAKGLSRFAFLAVGTVFAYFVVTMIPVETTDAKYFIFICGMISIMAMILPGISGSFLLLILGKYEYITGAIKNPTSIENLIVLGIFAIGALCGLLSFSKLLNFLLKKYHGQTIDFLVGVLFGSLVKLWPWKETLETVVIRGKVKILREANILPAQFDGEVMSAICACLFGMLIIGSMEFYRSRKN